MGQKTQDKNSKNWKNRRRKFRQKTTPIRKKVQQDLGFQKNQKKTNRRRKFVGKTGLRIVGKMI
ncbi:MAG: hypothetical protein ACLTC3_08040 [Evtepia gabavorous]|jgi:hypothetical protein